MKRILTLILTVAICGSAYASGNSASASQTIQLVLAPTIEFSANGMINTNLNGESFTVRANNGFTVSVNTLEPGQSVNLSVVGSEKKDGIKLTTAAKSLLSNSKSDEQTFAVNYKAKHNAGVIYTATQP